MICENAFEKAIWASLKNAMDEIRECANNMMEALPLDNWHFEEYGDNIRMKYVALDARLQDLEKLVSSPGNDHKKLKQQWMYAGNWKQSWERCIRIMRESEKMMSYIGVR